MQIDALWRRRLGGTGCRLVLGFLLLSLSFLGGVPAMAQDSGGKPPQVITAGIYVSPPFVIGKDGRYGGMAVELWELIAAEAGYDTRFRAFPTLADMVAALEKKEIDVAVTNLSITQERARKLSFTQPWYDAGLRIMVPAVNGNSFWDLLSGLERSGHLRVYAWIGFLILVASALMTLFDRRFDKEFPARWRDGLAESFYHVMSMVTSGKSLRKNLFGWIGRIWQGLWLACGVALIAYLTSSVTSVMTANSLSRDINSLADLPGKTVGVFTGSVAETFCLKFGIDTVSYNGIEEAVAAMLGDQIDAIIGDAPVLEYYTHSHPAVKAAVVGGIFHPDKYGFATTLEDPLARTLTVRILGLQESGRIQELRMKYFGNEP